MSVSNQVAANNINAAITRLVDTYDVNLPTADKQRITYALTKLQIEYHAVLGDVQAKSYSEITGGITSAAGRLRKIAADRQRLTRSMDDAASVLNTVNKVLGLVGLSAG